MVLLLCVQEQLFILRSKKANRQTRKVGNSIIYKTITAHRVDKYRPLVFNQKPLVWQSADFFFFFCRLTSKSVSSRRMKQDKANRLRPVS